MQLLSFELENYASFNEKQKISFNNDRYHTNAIFGPNGSGKTNFFRALAFFRDFVLKSTDYDNMLSTCEPFRLRKGSQERPSKFTAEFRIGQYFFCYSFSVLGVEVVDESLERRRSPAPNASSETIFRRRSIRNGVYDEYGFTKDLLSSTRSDALILTRAYQINNPIARKCFDFFKNFHLIVGRQSTEITLSKIANNPDYKERVLALLKTADLYIQDISAHQTPPMELTSSLGRLLGRPSYSATTAHLVRDEHGQVVDVYHFDLNKYESIGTQRILELAAPILDTLENGNILYIDEFETALHPRECLFLVGLFADNPQGAHLIINTHCTQIMDAIGYKNILLFGKNRYEETIVGKISSEARNTALEKKYNNGLFGAVPQIGAHL